MRLFRPPPRATEKAARSRAANKLTTKDIQGRLRSFRHCRGWSVTWPARPTSKPNQLTAGPRPPVSLPDPRRLFSAEMSPTRARRGRTGVRQSGWGSRGIGHVETDRRAGPVTRSVSRQSKALCAIPGRKPNRVQAVWCCLDIGRTWRPWQTAARRSSEANGEREAGWWERMFFQPLVLSFTSPSLAADLVTSVTRGPRHR